MSRRGENLPGFRARQLEFAAHIRDPQRHPRPGDVPEDRMRIYRELFYNNIESFLASAFPVAKQLLQGERWHLLVRGFLSNHGSETPYFLEISQEFLTYLGAAELPGEFPPFLLELCHYEWVELCLGVAEEDLPEQGIDPAGDLLTGIPVVSPLTWKLAYRYPVHTIGPQNQPLAPGPHPTQLVVFRRRDDTVGFMELNGLTMALLDGLEPGDATGAAVLGRMAERVAELGLALDGQAIRENGLATLERLRKAGVLLGTRTNFEGFAG
jgi:uncharacterized protein